MTLVAGHLARDRILVGAQDLAHLLGIELRGELGRAHEIGEHHRQLPALGLAHGSGLLSGAGPLERRHLRAQGGDGGEQLATMADRGHAEAGQVLGHELGQDLRVDIVVEEGPLVLAQTQPLEPSPDVQAMPLRKTFLRLR